MTTPSIPEQALELAALNAIEGLVKSRKDTVRKDLAATLTDLGVTGAAAKLEGATILKATMTDPQAAASVTNPKALLKWVEENYPTEVEVVPQIRASFQERLLQDLVQVDPDDGEATEAVDPRTGAIVPGVEFRKGSPYLSSRFQTGGKEAIVQYVMEHGVGAVTTLGPKAVEG